MLSNLVKNLSKPKFTIKPSTNVAVVSLTKSSNYQFFASQSKRPLSTFLFGSGKRMTLAEEYAELEKKFDYSNVRNNSKQILLGLMTLTAFHSVMGAPDVPTWNAQNDDMGSEDEDEYYGEPGEA